MNLPKKKDSISNQQIHFIAITNTFAKENNRNENTWIADARGQQHNSFYCTTLTEPDTSNQKSPAQEHLKFFRETFKKPKIISNSHYKHFKLY